MDSPIGFVYTPRNGTVPVRSAIAVPPPLARAIAGAIVKALGVEPGRPEAPLDLGDPALLYMEMSEAAEHFSANALNGRRDRKSGSKKRKQHEIEEARRKLRVVHG
jgi:DNA (cytosine-5)-methyltransferase 1